MLRTTEKQLNVAQGLLSQTGSRNTHYPFEVSAISQSLHSAAELSSSERRDSGSIPHAEKGYIYDEWTRYRATSPREYATLEGRRTLPALGSLAGPTQDLSKRSSPDVDRQQSSKSHGNVATPETHVLSRARNLLVDYGQLYADKDIRPELLLKLASMMTELEAQQSLQQEVQELKMENAALRNENANFRAYFTSRLPTNEPIINSSSTSTPPIFPKLPSDTSGKSWDRIVMDLI
ncbi:hypothetical protein APSETT444_006951 [Aspergillus pseudonomiae]